MTERLQLGERVAVHPEQKIEEIEPHERHWREGLEEYKRHVFNEAWRSVDQLRHGYGFIVRANDEKIEAWRNNMRVLNDLEEAIEMARTEKPIIEILGEEKRNFNKPIAKTQYIGELDTSMYHVDSAIAAERYLFWTDVKREFVSFQEFVTKGDPKLFEREGPELKNFKAREWIRKEARRIRERMTQRVGEEERPLDEITSAKLAALKAISIAKAAVFENFIGNYTGESHNVERVQAALQTLAATIETAAAAGHEIPRAVANIYLDGYQREVARLRNYPASRRLNLIKPHRFFVSGGPDQLAGLVQWAEEAIDTIKVEEAQRMRKKNVIELNSETIQHLARLEPADASVARQSLNMSQDMLRTLGAIAARILLGAGGAGGAAGAGGAGAGGGAGGGTPGAAGAGGGAGGGGAGGAGP